MDIRNQLGQSELTEVEYGEKGRSTLFASHPVYYAGWKLVQKRS